MWAVTLNCVTTQSNYNFFPPIKLPLGCDWRPIWCRRSTRRTEKWCSLPTNSISVWFASIYSRGTVTASIRNYSNCFLENVFQQNDYVSWVNWIVYASCVCRKLVFIRCASAMNSQHFRIKSFIWISKWAQNYRWHQTSKSMRPHWPHSNRPLKRFTRVWTRFWIIKRIIAW